MSGLHAALGDLRALLPAPWSEVALVFVSFACGAIVGVERERNDKPAGLRTIVLICLGATILTLASVNQPLGGSDPARVAAQIVTGVGFLGAGSIMRDGFGISGLTTAATIWATAAVGIVVGAGYAAGGLALSVGILLTLGALKRIDARLAGPCRVRRIWVVFRGDPGKARALVQRAIDQTSAAQATVGRAEARGDGTALLLSCCTRHRDHRALLAAVAAVPEVERLESLEGWDEEGGPTK